MVAQRLPINMNVLRMVMASLQMLLVIGACRAGANAVGDVVGDDSAEC